MALTIWDVIQPVKEMAFLPKTSSIRLTFSRKFLILEKLLRQARASASFLRLAQGLSLSKAVDFAAGIRFHRKFI